MRSWIRVGLLVAVVGALAAPVAFGVSGSDTISTIAGTGTAGFVGDGGQATSAQLNQPWGVAVAAGGSVYIGDLDNNRVRRVSGGIITTVAGTGTAGSTGDGGQATSAQVNGPLGVAVDAQGNLYIAEFSGHRVRKVSGGIITTVAGTGTAGSTGDGGQATSAQLNYPYDVAVDAQGNLYIADAGNNRVRKVSGGIITTFAGTGTAGSTGDGGQATSAQLNEPGGVAVDANGDVYIADQGNNKIRKVSGGIITTIAGAVPALSLGDGGQATSAQLNSPWGVAVDAAGSLYIADYGNKRIRKVTGGIITTIAGTGAAGSSGDGGPASSAQLNGPTAVEVDGQGNLYIADYNGHRVRLIANKPPVASLDASPLSGQAPLNVAFTGSGSDPDGSIASYAWNFGDNTTASGASVSHLYTSAGTFHVTLTVTDDSGATASASRDVTVSAAATPPPPPPPKPKLSSTAASFGKATAGRLFSVSFAVKEKTTGKGVRGSLSCGGKLAGQSLATFGRSTGSSGRAVCTWRLPAGTAGEVFAGTISETYRGVKVSRSFSVTVKPKPKPKPRRHA